MSTPLVMAEGVRIDHFGNAISTTYVDLRDPAGRHPIHSLVKGCRPEHLIEACGQVRIATPRSFRDTGESQIRDAWEGLFSQTRLLHDAADDPRDLARAKERDAVLNRLSALVGSGVRRRTTRARRQVSKTETMDYAPVGWLFCCSIEPTTADEWTEWKATLEDGYDSQSRIYRPREFASALGHMAAEHLGPQGARIPVTSSARDFPSFVTQHPSQAVFHGPVAYRDDVATWLRDAKTEAELFLRSVFTKSATHRAQREYRFVMWADTAPEGDVHLLPASPALVGAMTKRGDDPTPPVLQAMEPDMPGRDVENEEGAEPNPLDGSKLWRNLEASFIERAQEPGAVVKPHQPDPASLPQDFDRQVATYAGVTALRSKLESLFRLDELSLERKRAAAAAAWFAEQGIRALCEHFEDPVRGISISDDGYVVIHISVAESPGTVCQLAVAPSGESTLTMEADNLRRESTGLDPFHRTSVGQKVRDFLAGATK